MTMAKNVAGLFVLGMVAVLTSSCATRALWRATDPLEYVAVPQDEVSESELQESGVSYRKDDEHGLYYVEKSSLRRLGDYSMRACATPVTVCLDVAPVISCILAMGALDDLARRSGGRGQAEWLWCLGVTSP